MRVRVWVRPGSGRNAVGGDRDGAVIVRVVPPAEGGKATQAALRALAEALGVPRSAMRLVSGQTSRYKLVDIQGDEAELAARIGALRQAS
jgi:uncharacterized protein